MPVLVVRGRDSRDEVDSSDSEAGRPPRRRRWPMMVWRKTPSAGHQSIKKRKRRRRRPSIGEVGSAGCAAWVADAGGDVAAVQRSLSRALSVYVCVPESLILASLLSVFFCIALLIYPIVHVVSGI